MKRARFERFVLGLRIAVGTVFVAAGLFKAISVVLGTLPSGTILEGVIGAEPWKNLVFALCEGVFGIWVWSKWLHTAAASVGLVFCSISLSLLGRELLSQNARACGCFPLSGNLQPHSILITLYVSVGLAAALLVAFCVLYSRGLQRWISDRQVSVVNVK